MDDMDTFERRLASELERMGFLYLAGIARSVAKA